MTTGDDPTPFDAPRIIDNEQLDDAGHTPGEAKRPTGKRVGTRKVKESVAVGTRAWSKDGKTLRNHDQLSRNATWMRVGTPVAAIEVHKLKIERNHCTGGHQRAHPNLKHLDGRERATPGDYVNDERCSTTHRRQQGNHPHAGRAKDLSTRAGRKAPERENTSWASQRHSTVTIGPRA